MKIWKYSFLHGENEIRMPLDAEVVHVATQGEGAGETATLWAKVDVNKPKETRRFYAAHTGEEVPDDAEYLGTAVLYDGGYVLHLFEGWR